MRPHSYPTRACGSGAAHAVELFTPPLGARANEWLICTIINVGTGPTTISVALREFATGADVSDLNHCPETLPPGGGCHVFGKQGEQGYCHFKSSSSKVRAVVLVAVRRGLTG